MSKRFIKRFLLIAIAALLLYNGYTAAQTAVLEKSFVVKDYNVSISFPKKWKVETKNNNPFDLQCTNGFSFASVFVFNKADIKEGQSPLETFRIQNDDIVRKRSNVKVINDEKTEKLGNKQIYSILYSAEKGDTGNYYYCNLIDFGEGSDRLVWILFTALPSYAIANFETMKKIVASTVLIK